MTNKEVEKVLQWGKSHTIFFPGLVMGVTKFQAFLAIKPLLNGAQYWRALSEAYQMSDNLYQYREDVRLAFSSEEPRREYLMTKEERNQLRKLPNELKIYRGMTEEELNSGEHGVSWTIKEDVAKFFADTYQRNYDTRKMKKTVHSLIVNKEEVLAYWDSRNEGEIIYLGNWTSGPRYLSGS